MYDLSNFTSFMELGAAFCLAFAVVDKFGKYVSVELLQKVSDESLKIIEASDEQKQVITEEVKELVESAKSGIVAIILKGRFFSVLSGLILTVQLALAGFYPSLHYNLFAVGLFIILPSITLPIIMGRLWYYSSDKIEGINNKINADKYALDHVNKIDKKVSEVPNK